MINMQTLAAPIVIQHFCSILLKGEGLESAERLLSFLKKVQTSCADHPEIERFLSSPRTPFKHVKAFLEKVAADLHLPEDLLGPLEVLAEFGLFNYLDDVCQRLEDSILEAKGITHVVCTSAHPLDDATQGEINATLTRFGITQPKFENHVDPSLMKGYKLLWDHQVYDKSLKKGLDHLYHTLTGDPL